MTFSGTYFISVQIAWQRDGGPQLPSQRGHTHTVANSCLRRILRIWWRETIRNERLWNVYVRCWWNRRSDKAAENGLVTLCQANRQQCTTCLNLEASGEKEKINTWRRDLEADVKETVYNWRPISSGPDCLAESCWRPMSQEGQRRPRLIDLALKFLTGHSHTHCTLSSWQLASSAAVPVSYRDAKLPQTSLAQSMTFSILDILSKSDEMECNHLHFWVELRYLKAKVDTHTQNIDELHFLTYRVFIQSDQECFTAEWNDVGHTCVHLLADESINRL